MRIYLLCVFAFLMFASACVSEPVATDESSIDQSLSEEPALEDRSTGEQEVRDMLDHYTSPGGDPESLNSEDATTNGCNSANGCTWCSGGGWSCMQCQGWPEPRCYPVIVA